MSPRAASPLIAWALLGCVRVISPAAQADEPTRENGEPCSSSTVCVSGQCVDGLCCDRACLPVESCALPDTRGSCTRRPLGAACIQDAQCPLQFCVDGVCCAQACSGGCEQCDAPGSAGRCVNAANNTDPRNHCGGRCLACFGGVCAPAVVGSNPPAGHDGGVTCPATQACDPEGTCKAALAQPCQSTNGGSAFSEACASQVCLADVCQQPFSERLPVGQGNPAAGVKEIMDGALVQDGTACLLIRELEYETLPARPFGTGPYAFFERRLGLTLTCRQTQGWVGRTLVDFLLTQSGAQIGPDSGGITVNSRFKNLLQLRSSAPGVVMLAHVPRADGIGSPRVAEQLGAQNCDVLASWFYGDVASGGRRCLIPEVPNPDNVVSPVAWYSAQVVEGAHFVLAVSVHRTDSGEVYLYDCLNGACQTPKSVAVDDVRSWPGLLLLEEGRPLVFHFPESFDRLRALDGNVTSEILLEPGCTLGQHQIDGAGAYNADYPARSLNAARVVRNGQPVWLLSLLCGGALGTVLYDPAAHVFVGPAQRVEAGGDDLLGGTPVTLPDNRDALLVAKDNAVLFAWRREDGSQVQQRVRDVSQGGLDIRGVWGQAQRGLPQLAWEEVERNAVEVPDTPIAEWPVRSASTLYFKAAAQ